jgi:hypothetical protein
MATGARQVLSPVWCQDSINFIGIGKVHKKIDIGSAEVAITVKCKFSAIVWNEILFE